MKIVMDGKYLWYILSLILYESKVFVDNDLCMFKREYKEFDKD